MSDETAAPLSPLKRAFLAVQSLQGKVDELQAARTEPIAVIGLSCRFPGAENADRYWDLLAGGVDAVTERPADRWPAEMLAEDDVVGERGSHWGGFLRSVDTFDPQFFSLAPREAAGMDPQQRLFLEVCWEALENAGIAADKLNGHPTGVFAGACTNDYWNLQLRGGDLGTIGTHFASGIAHSIITGRVSYLLGLTGPSVTVDTACSSSLTATHLACQALRNGDCEMALAGGVSVILLPDIAVSYARSGMAAVDGRCKVFDASADGFVRGEGCGVVVLKRLSKALADGDIIHALIRGSALNQDGASSSMTAPSGPAQEAVIKSALRSAGVKPSDVSYVEAHGTGTVLGDPIELQAIGAALAPGRESGNDVLVGSVKSNFGHLEASAGVAGLIKIILSIRHGAIPASLHFKTPNPMIPWDHLPVRVPTTLTPWNAPLESRVAGISGFGFSGTNAHLIVSGPPVASTEEPSAIERPSQLITLSAPTETGLLAIADRLAEHISTHPEQSIADVAHTTNVGRSHFRHRAAFVVNATDTVAARLRALAAGDEELGVAHGRVHGSEPPRVVFLFSGQGSQYAGMGRRLYATQPTFRRAVEECDELLRTELQPGVLQVLFPAGGERPLLDETRYTQPVLFSLEYALAVMWQSWGIQPTALMGHSLGEFVAATLAGVLRLEDALRLVAVRGRLGQTLPTSGSMAAVLTDVTRVRDVLASQGNAVTIAAINAPENNVISGPTAAMEAALAVFTADRVEVRRLPISNAFHSPAIEPMLAEFEAAASAISYGTQRVPVFSNLFGRRARVGEMSNARYWTRHLREPVQFAAGFAAAVSEGFSTFLEVGPHTTLVGLGRQCFPDDGGLWLPTLRRGYDDWEVLLGSLAKLYVAGARVDWAGFDRDYRRRRVALPTYPFERQRYWFSASTARSAPRASSASRVAALHPLLDRRINSPFVPDAIFETELSLDTLPWLGDHRVLGAAVLPATAHLEATWAAASLVFGDGVSAIEDVDIHDALVTPDGSSRTMQLAVSPAEGDSARFRIMSAETGATGADAWHAHASGTVSLKPEPRGGSTGDLAAIRARCGVSISPERLYDAVSARGIELGSRFRGVTELYQGEHQALGRVQAPPDVAAERAQYHLHPALLDAALHVVTAALFDDASLATSNETYMPIALERFRILAKTDAGDLWSHVVARARKPNESPVVDVNIFDAGGTAVAEVIGLQFRRVESAAWASASHARVDDQLYQVEWKPAAAEPTIAATAGWSAPEPREVVESISDTIEQVAQRNRLDEYNRRMPELDALCRDYIIEALTSLGWAPAVGARENETALGDRLRVVKQHRRLFHRLLQILAEDGLLARDGDEWIVRKPLAVAGAAVDRLTALRSSFAEASGELGLLATAGPELAACLAGRADPLSLLFPGGSFDAADELYRRSPPALVANTLARHAVQRFVAEAPAGAPIRVLEIGAGTGGTTAVVLPVLPADRTTYTFTDLSPLFLARAEERMSEYPFVDYSILDIERDPSTQDVDQRGFDLVIAANVLHATRDLAETLSHARQLVRPGGLLLVLESSRPQRWIDLTFGLTDGWWRFADHALRSDYPLIDRAKWTSALSAAGFEAASAVPADARGDVFEPNLIVMARTPQTARGRWIVFADAGGVSKSLAAELRGAGRDVVLVRPADSFRRDGENYVIPPTDADAYKRLIDSVSGDDAQAVAGMIHLWSLDVLPTEGASLDGLHAAEDVGCRSALLLAQAAATSDAATSSRLVLVTRGAQSARGGDVSAPVHATMWGLASTIRLEHPDLRCLSVDLDPNGSPAASDVVARILSSDEPQLAVRDGAWSAARLARQKRPAAPPAASTRAPDERVQLVNTTPGVLDGLSFAPSERRALGEHEIEIRVATSALNFRDVLIAMALYPGASATDALGGECAGEVVAVGTAVTRFAPGDSVVAMAAGGLGSHAIAHEEHVMRRPDGLTLDEAVTIPSVFVTAWHSLYDLAGLTSGERVLIHAGAGGVGLAAIQLAKRVGAEVFATAGSPAKRAFLASIGVHHVMDSRSLKYVDEIAELTGGKGVDVVLNSLADKHIDASFSALADGGRFIELGKRGIWSKERVAETRPSLRYFVVDLAAVGVDNPAAVGDVLRRVRAALVAGDIQPLPRVSYAAADVGAAFRFMAQAKHIGKIVVRRGHVPDPTAVRHDGTYLITGGLGGIGMVMAAWLLKRGAGHVVLTGRGEPDEETRKSIAEWNESAPRVSIVRGDVGSEADVQRVFTHIGEQQWPLRGILHSAGVLRDGVLVGQDWPSFATTFGPKVNGAWNLHRSSQDAPLDFFVLFSSISSLFGSPGQANHAAANAFMDALAHYRRAHALPALSINWGAWADVGAALERGVAARIGTQGMGTISPQTGIDVLERLLEDNSTQSAAMPVDWSRFAAQFGGGRLRGSFLAELASSSTASAPQRAAPIGAPASRAPQPSIREAPVGTRWEMLLERMRTVAARVLGLDSALSLPADRALQEMGLDSLMAVELRNLMKTEFGLQRAVPATIVFDHPTLHALTEYVGSTIFGWPSRTIAQPVAAERDEIDLLDQLESLSPAEVDRLLSQRMTQGD
ncbi:MAG: SDR family oxidoreductase [bacterium]